jgi:hypothetical protein
MASPLEICNSALTKLGGRRIDSLTQNIKEARLCNEAYPLLRDELLQSHPWNFATARVELAQLTSIPAFDYDYEYQLPSDCLRVIDIENPDYDIKWEVSGDKLLSNEETVKIKYIKKETNTSKFSPVFIQALSLRLAWDLAYSLIQSGTQAQYWQSAYENYLRSARSYDSQEGKPEEVIDEYNDIFLNSRY